MGALLSAFENAKLKKTLSFALKLSRAPSEAELNTLHLLGIVRFHLSDRFSFQALWQGEPLVFSVSPAMQFYPGWDLRLRFTQARLKRTSDRFVLSGLPPLEDTEVDAVCPVGLKGSIPDLVFQRGLPLLRSSEPIQTAFPVPECCFGPSAFFRQTENSLLFLTAFRHGWNVMTLPNRIARSTLDLTPESCSLPAGEEENIARFSRRFGIDFRAGSENISGQARSGIFTPDLSFPVHTPVIQKIQRKKRLNSFSSLSLMCITAVSGANTDCFHTPEEHNISVRYLTELQKLSLLCYADRKSLATLILKKASTLEYMPEYGLPLHWYPTPENEKKALSLGKMFLLDHSRKRFPGHTHLGWIDPGCVFYPADPETEPDITPFCTDRIVMGTVKGEPDLSIIIVPDELLSALCGEITVLCGGDLRKFVHLPYEADVWAELIRKFPNRFTLIPVYEKYGLIARILHVGSDSSLIEK